MLKEPLCVNMNTMWRMALQAAVCGAGLSSLRGGSNTNMHGRARAGPVRGSALATKFEDYTVFTHIGVNPSVRTEGDQKMLLK
jgi:hypothetical protein